MYSHSTWTYVGISIGRAYPDPAFNKIGINGFIGNSNKDAFIEVTETS